MLLYGKLYDSANSCFPYDVRTKILCNGAKHGLSEGKLFEAAWIDNHAYRQPAVVGTQKAFLSEGRKSPGIIAFFLVGLAQDSVRFFSDRASFGQGGSEESETPLSTRKHR